MTKLTKDQVLDFKNFFVEEGEKNFSPERNKRIVEDSIKEYELRRKLIQDQFSENLAERTDAVAHLLKAIDHGKTTNALAYFGKKELARLRGQDIISEMRLRMAAMQRNLDAEKKFKN